MPIYVYKCASCGFVEEKLQKVSDPQPKVCPSCGAAALAKQVTAAGFELKGSGWYVTDFRNEGAAPGSKSEDATATPATSEHGHATPAAQAADSAAPAKATKPAEKSAAPAGGAAAKPATASTPAAAP